ncbi:MAG: DUF4097 family beta strand repeat-containing protein [Candidatus Thermoplasmatota archaeon]|jgi:hypothetical protein
MVSRVGLALLLFAALVLPGCTSLGNETGDSGSEGAPTGPGAGTAAGHGAAQRSETAVVVTRENDRYYARMEITVENDFGGASRSQVRMTTFNGGAQFFEGGNGGYVMLAQLYGTGETEQEARDALDILTLDASDSLALGSLTLAFTIREETLPGSPLPIPSITGSTQNFQNGAALRITLPGDGAHDLGGQTTNGAVRSSGLHGPAFSGDTSNGGVSADGDFEAVTATTTNGGIDLDGTYNTVEATTSNGGISGRLAWSRSGHATLKTSNGAIDLGLVSDDDTGFDVSAQTTNGRITLAIDGDSASGNSPQSARSPGYDSKQAKVQIDAETTNGRITIQTV